MRFWTIGYTDRAENVIKADTIELADDGYAIFRDSEDGVVHVVARQSFSYATRAGVEADDEDADMPTADELINDGIKLFNGELEDVLAEYNRIFKSYTDKAGPFTGYKHQ